MVDEIEMMRELVRELRDEHIRLKAEIDELKDKLIWAMAIEKGYDALLPSPIPIRDKE